MKRRGVAPVIIACALAPSCGLLVDARPCSVDDDCLPTEICLPEGSCGPGAPAEGPGVGKVDAGVPEARLEILGIEGDGSERPPSGALPDVGQAPLVLAKRRIRSALEIRGRGLSSVKHIELRHASQELTFEKLTFRDGGTDVARTLILPAGLMPGLYTLTLIAQSTTASAQVYLLQGEPGPPGEPGPAGPAGPAALSRVVPLAPGHQQCAAGGVLIQVGVDSNGNGSLDDEEVTSSGPVCGASQALTCQGNGACRLNGDLEVTGLLKARSPLDDSVQPVATQLEGTQTFTVGPNGDFDNLAAALGALRPMRIAPDALVTLQLEAGVHELSATVVVDHPDGERLEIVGADEDPESTKLRFTLGPNQNQNGIEVYSALGRLSRLTLERTGQGPRSGLGFVAVGPASARLEPPLVVRGFYYGVSAIQGARVIANGFLDQEGERIAVKVEGNVVGFSARTRGVLFANYGHAASPYAQQGGTFGFLADLGGTIYGEHASAEGHTYGFMASHGSVLIAPKSTASGPSASGPSWGYLSQYGSSVQARNSQVTNVSQVGYFARYSAGMDALATTVINAPKEYCARFGSALLHGDDQNPVVKTNCP